jgi:N utilization substance protein A
MAKKSNRWWWRFRFVLNVSYQTDFEIGEEVSEEVKLIDLGRAISCFTSKLDFKKYMSNDNTNLYKAIQGFNWWYLYCRSLCPRVVILVDDEGNEIVLQKKTNSIWLFRKDNVRGAENWKGNKNNYV